MTDQSLPVPQISDKSNILLQALRYLAARCDGAEAKDGAGFNKPDSWLGKKLAERDYLTEDETLQAFQMLPKYTAQLEAGGITLPEREKVIAAAKQADLGRGVIVFNDMTNLLIVKFPYNQQHVAKVKTIDKARFNDDGEKFWTVPLASGKKLLEVFPGFTITDEAKEAIATWEPPKFAGKIICDGDELAISFEYDAALVTRVKGIQSAHFDGKQKLWRVGIDKAEIALIQLPDFEVDPAVHIRVQDEWKKAQEQAAKDRVIAESLLQYIDAPLPSGRTLYEHQKTGIKFLLEKRRVILADDLGLGKSTTSLVAAKAYGVPIIVVCPVSVKINWQREAEIVGAEISVYSWAKLPEPPSHDYVVIGDEAHAIQSMKAQRTQKMMTLCADYHCLGLYLLTGTPIKNGRPVGLYPLLKATRHPLAEDKSAYERYYCNAHPTRFTRWDVTGAAHLEELHAKTRDVILRRLKADCIDLPEKTRVIQSVDLSDKAAAEYKVAFDALRADYHQRIAEGKISSASEAMVMLQHLRHAGSQAKTENAISLSEEVIEQGGQVVVFVAFKEPGQTVAKALGVNLFSGDTPTKERQDMVDRFQKGQDKAFVCTLGAGGVGITLTAAQTVILVDRPWTSGDSIQAEDRLHRIGQKSNVTAIWLQYGDVDVAVDELLQSKQERIDLILQGKRRSLRGVNGSALGAVQEILQGVFD